MGPMGDSVARGSPATGTDGPTAAPNAAPPWPPRSRVDRPREDAALACVRGGRPEEALKILMTTYGAPLTAFTARIVRDHELAKDIRQHVFLAAFQRIDTFEGRGSLWSWLCGIAYHRCLDELKRIRRAGTIGIDDFDALVGLAESSDVAMGPDHGDHGDRVAKRRAIEHCLGKLSISMRAQLLMRCHLGLGYAEIGDLVGDPPGTVQVRISRILPRLRRCLQREGVMR
jgi:RNA polymerase sigma-70 factor (ECF subfamily)